MGATVEGCPTMTVSVPFVPTEVEVYGAWLYGKSDVVVTSALVGASADGDLMMTVSVAFPV